MDRADGAVLHCRAADQPGDLQRSLESRGIDLQGLDFGLAPDAEAGASRDDGRAQQRAGASATGVSRDASDEDDADDLLITPTTATQSVELPAGALVDVRA